MEANSSSNKQLGMCLLVNVDLHGMTKDESDIALRAFVTSKRKELKKMKRKNPKAILVFIVVTGKGRHSKNGPTIKPFVDKFLDKGNIAHHECGTGGGYK